MNKKKMLHDLYDRFDEAVRSALRTPAKFVRGDGAANAQIVFVGEAPGLDEDRQGRPFVGRAGTILNGWLDSLSLRRQDVYVTNVVKCHPMKNDKTPDARGNDRPPTETEIQLCWPILEEELRILDPAAIVTLGSPAMRTLLQTREKISELRGRPHPFPPAPALSVFPIYHPAALCHNPGLKPLVLRDLQELRRHLQSHRAAWQTSRAV